MSEDQAKSGELLPKSGRPRGRPKGTNNLKGALGRSAVQMGIDLANKEYRKQGSTDRAPKDYNVMAEMVKTAILTDDERLRTGINKELLPYLHRKLAAEDPDRTRERELAEKSSENDISVLINAVREEEAKKREQIGQEPAPELTQGTVTEDES